MKRRDFFGIAAVGCLFPAKSVKAEESVKPTLEGMTDEEMAKFLSEQTLQKVSFDGPNYRKWLIIHDPRIWMYNYVSGSKVIVNSMRGCNSTSMIGCFDLQPGSRTSVNMIKMWDNHVRTFWRLEEPNGWFSFDAPWTGRITVPFPGVPYGSSADPYKRNPDIIDGRVDRTVTLGSSGRPSSWRMD